jgi:hypothetical protein
VSPTQIGWQEVGWNAIASVTFVRSSSPLIVRRRRVLWRCPDGDMEEGERERTGDL